jgi:adenosine deaminase
MLRLPCSPNYFAAAFVLASSLASGQTPSPRFVPRHLTMEQRFAALRKSPLELHAFLYAMPKGGDLHNHLSGAVYAESFLRGAVGEGLCIDVQLLALAPRTASGCAAGQVPALDAQSDNTLSNALIDNFSMRDFVPSAGHSAHDHFFDTFNKFGAIDSTQFVSEVVERAADQNESYLELMALSGGGPIANLGKQTGLDADFEVTRRKLDAAGLANAVAAMRARLDELDARRRQTLGCDRNPGSAPCRVEVRYIYQVLREFPKEQVFAQVLGGFALAASDARVAAVNFVQAEDGLVSMRDYHLQMQMVDFAKKIYPAVHITLHAGELAPGLVPPEGLRFHIREAVELGHAERIGHGVDLMYERDPIGLLAEMRAKHILVEINLTSNDVILGVSGASHPFPVYRKYGVPVALSTDDEGVSRSQLTEEYEKAVLTWQLTYADLKQMVRNSVEYSFAPGGSYWTSSAYQSVVSACAAGRRTDSCLRYLAQNDKARVQADLEDRFSVFEKTLGNPR